MFPSPSSGYEEDTGWEDGVLVEVHMHTLIVKQKKLKKGHYEISKLKTYQAVVCH